MAGDYQKVRIEMERVSSDYRLWKRAADSVACIAETYKNKRSMFFAASNLLPSAVLLREENKEYHLLLIGAESGELIHKDFGAFYVNHQGEGSLFKKFTGPALECYSHCLLVAVEQDSEETETVFSGRLSFDGRNEGRPAERTSTAFGESMRSAESCKDSDGADLAGDFKEEHYTGDQSWKEIFDRFDACEKVEAFAEGWDETGAVWCRVDRSSPLPKSLQPCSNLITTYGHYIIGRNEKERFIGIPGRFLQREQPLRKDRRFTLWQPIRGGEHYFTDLHELTGELAEEIFGYWISAVDMETGEIVPL